MSSVGKEGAWHAKPWPKPAGGSSRAGLTRKDVLGRGLEEGEGAVLDYVYWFNQRRFPWGGPGRRSNSNQSATMGHQISW